MRRAWSRALRPGPVNTLGFETLTTKEMDWTHPSVQHTTSIGIAPALEAGFDIVYVYARILLPLSSSRYTTSARQVRGR